MSTVRMNTAVIQTRVDIRVLAGLARYAKEKGRSPKDSTGFSKAKLVQTSLETLHDALRIEGKLEHFESSSEALGYMEELGYGMENSINRGKLQEAISGETFAVVELLGKTAVPEGAKNLLSGSD